MKPYSITSHCVPLHGTPFSGYLGEDAGQHRAAREPVERQEAVALPDVVRGRLRETTTVDRSFSEWARDEILRSATTRLRYERTFASLPCAAASDVWNSREREGTRTRSSLYVTLSASARRALRAARVISRPTTRAEPAIREPNANQPEQN